MSARSRNPDTESFGIESSSVLASSRLHTGVLPFLTTYFGPRTECAGFDGVICRTIVTRASSKGWIPELIAVAGLFYTTEIFCALFGILAAVNRADDSLVRPVPLE